MEQVFSRPQSLIDVPFHFCPGCHHGIIHRLTAECIDRYALQETSIAVASVGCSVFLYDYLDVDVLEAPHGRAAAVATGVKRARPDRFVFTYQGDGDLAAIGTAEIIHAANRGDRITVIFVNNTVFGMTGGQMAPTTMPGQETTTTPFGRDPAVNGFPIRMAELLGGLTGTTFVARGAVDTPKNLVKTRKYMQRAFEVQTTGEGFGFVEILSACPTNWKMSPERANKRVKEEMIPYFPLGIFKGGDA
ncbi:thiamine pyrophosphate-dependent enzyme [Desulfatiglans anilini]|uniref:thiamine pyrophosphate-dependent enzyme n=1 Tax=Desulfatiglans anilini TaxID=90728 RepID=UPI000405C205|nr:thiamine pyrophosphate-dependent enzyme [Desulfatiglans anilini]